MQRLNRHVALRQRSLGTPQTVRAQRNQVQNNAGGFVFQVNPFEQLRRFLILGTEGGTFYVNENKLTQQNCAALDACLKMDHRSAVNMIVEVGQNAPKMDPVLFAYARACSTGSSEERHYALSLLNEVCRTGYQLFMFMENVKTFRGFGKGLRKALSRWYLTRSPRDVAFQITKYKQREGWSHGDVLRIAHPVPGDADMELAFNYALIGYKDKEGQVRKVPDFSRRLPRVADSARDYLAICEAVKHEEDVGKIVQLVEKYRLPREVLPTEVLKSPRVWEAMLNAGMPMTALIRNLGTLSRLGLLIRGDRGTTHVVTSQLTNAEALRKGRIHPMQLLVAYKTYKSGHGTDGNSTWTPVSDVVDALEEAFYTSFGTIQPSGKNFMLAVDYSGSMSAPITTTRNGQRRPLGIDCREAASVMAMVTARTEKCDQIYGFDHEMVRFPITNTMKLDRVMKELSNWKGGGTDCAQPALYAMRHGKKFDAICMYTDNETWFGGTHPFQAIQAYRQSVSRNCRQVVVGMTSTGFSIADPSDPLSLDVVGFDITAPQAISWFAQG